MVQGSAFRTAAARSGLPPYVGAVATFLVRAGVLVDKSVVPTIAPDLDWAKLGEVQEGGQTGMAYLEADSSRHGP